MSQVVEGQFSEIVSTDFLNFTLNGRTYKQQMSEAYSKSKVMCSINTEVKELPNGLKVVWAQHIFGFIGGSLGCAEGEKLCLSFELAEKLKLPIVVVCRSGGARMQEGTLSLMQMAKVSVAVNKFRKTKLPYVTVFQDPTFGGTTASYAMQSDIRIGLNEARIGFAGSSVILNTVYHMAQADFDRECPQGFQTASFLQKNGQIDILVEKMSDVDNVLGQLFHILSCRKGNLSETLEAINDTTNVKPNDYVNDYTISRSNERIQCLDIMKSSMFSCFTEVQGDGQVKNDRCIRGGFALFRNVPVMVIGTCKGHTAEELQETTYGMAQPSGYRMLVRLMKLAEHFGLPVITLIDTPGAYPSFSSEIEGQPEAIATALVTMAELKVPLLSLFVGEGGSGGALALAMGNVIGMLSGGYFGVITPEGAASILCRYRNEKEKLEKFHNDCKQIANMQGIYAEDLKRLGIVDDIIWEEKNETFTNCTKTLDRISNWVNNSLKKLMNKTAEELQTERFAKYRQMGNFSREGINREMIETNDNEKNTKINRNFQFEMKGDQNERMNKLFEWIGETTINGKNSQWKQKLPVDCKLTQKIESKTQNILETKINAKYILDKYGADEMVNWIQKQNRVLITDTTMRDAHQSLLATRVRTVDLLGAAKETSEKLGDLFSIEMWGGATFDVCVRFLRENPWERLKALRKAVPNICFQMLLRGSNAVGYKNYHKNVLKEFIRLCALNGIDVFRIFDCFNDINKMLKCIKYVRKYGKIAEVCICFTGDFLSKNETIYTLDYYMNLIKQLSTVGAHIICIKDMAGLFKPQMAKPFMKAVRSITNVPIHFHTHNTSGNASNSIIEMAKNGCNIVDCAISSMSDTTSQPSLNAFLSAMEGQQNDPKIEFRHLEELDMYWGQIRANYWPFESGLKSGTVRVYEHQIPGGQYSNLIAQCKALGLWDKWSEVLDMYRDVNTLFGNIIKVTPSSKCVGDMALFLINKGIKVEDVIEKGCDLEFPDTVRNLFKGLLGFPHKNFPSELAEKILKNEKPNTNAEVVTEEVDIKAHKAAIESKLGIVLSEEDVVSSLLYPVEFEDFIKFVRKYGDLPSQLPSIVFMYGMKVGMTMSLFDEKEQKECLVSLVRISPLTNDGSRTLVFQVDSNVYNVCVKEKKETSKVVKANTDNPSHIASPLPGKVSKITISTGDRIKKGSDLFVVEAMKMNVAVKAPHDGVVKDVCCKEGLDVENGSLLCVFEPHSFAPAPVEMI